MLRSFDIPFLDFVMSDAFDLDDFLNEFAKAASRQGFEEECIVEVEDGPVKAWVRPAGGPGFYISGGIHGDEPAGPLALLGLMKQGAFTKEFDWRICPALNPGGLRVGTRENRQGYDLNRDYKRLRSLEIAAHTKWLERQTMPDVFVSLHEDWESEGFYFYEINLGDDRPEIARGVFEAVSAYLPKEKGQVIDGHDVREEGWIYHCAEADLPDEWPEAIWLAKQGCPLSFTFETPSKVDLERRIQAHMVAMRSLLERADFMVTTQVQR